MGLGNVGLRDAGTQGRAFRGRGTQDLGTLDLEIQDSGTLGLGNTGTREHWDLGMSGLGDIGCEEVGTLQRMETWRCDKQVTPDFCAQFVKYNFWWS